MGFVFNPFTGKLDIVGRSSSQDDFCALFLNKLEIEGDGMIILKEDQCLTIRDSSINSSSRVVESVTIQQNGSLVIGQDSVLEVNS